VPTQSSPDIQQLIAQNKRYQDQFEALKRALAPEGGQPPTRNEMPEVVQSLMSGKNEAEQRAAEAERRAAEAERKNEHLTLTSRRNQIESSILSGASPTSQEQIRLMVPGLLQEAKVDLSSIEDRVRSAVM